MNNSIPTPIRRKNYLVFDVETTGLMPQQNRANYYSKASNKIEDYPYILQLSYAIYDLHEFKIVSTYDAYVQIPEDVEISEQVSSLTGITKEMCNTKGKPIIEVLEKFYEAYMFCNGLVAHNMDFDEKAISISMVRYRDRILEKSPHLFSCFQPMYEKIHHIERYCTMKQGTNICNILVASHIEGKPPRKKWPRLSELHQHLFPNETLKGLHNSMTDVLVCLRCYLKMRHNHDTGSLV